MLAAIGHYLRIAWDDLTVTAWSDRTARGRAGRRSRDGHADPDGQTGPGGLDLAERHALKRVSGLSTELQDVTEVEYRALRL